MAASSLTITDNRTGKSYEIPITNGAIRAMDLRQMRTGPEDFGLLSYDPAFTNTASCISRITEIDGDRGILRYRGYPIEELAERANYLEVAYLVLNGELPTIAQMDEWVYEVTHHTWVHENVKKFMDGFHHDAHPMGMLCSAVAALSTFYPEAKNGGDPETRKLQIVRLVAKMPTLAAFAYRHSLGMPYAYPDNDLSYTGNFLNMLFKTTEVKYQPNATLERALEVLFILHADHEQNCSTNAVRSVGSSQVDPYCALAGVLGGLRVGVEGRERRDGRDQHPHRVRVVVEAVHELLDVLVDPRVVGDLPRELLERPGRRQLAAQQEVGHLEEARLLGELLDRVAAIPEETLVTVDERDRAARGRGVREGGVVGQQAEILGPALDLAEIHRADRAVGDRYLVRLPGAVVDDRQALPRPHHSPPVRLQRR